MTYFRLRLARRLGLLGPALRFERRVERWVASPGLGRRPVLEPAVRRRHSTL
jgi:hypothetical protein